MQKIIGIITLILLLAACHSKRNNKQDQGIITYKIIYPEEVMQKSFATFLPKKMLITFKENDYKMTIKGDLSLYKLEVIANALKDTAATLFRVFDKRMFHRHDKTENLLIFPSVVKSKVKLLKNESQEIAGIICSKAIVSFKEMELPDITVFYSKEIPFDRFKDDTPFEKIPGALMKFSMPFKGLNLVFEAESVDYKSIKSKEFQIPRDYEVTNKGEIDELLTTLIQ